MIVCGYCVNGAHWWLKEYLAFLLVLGLCSGFRLWAKKGKRFSKYCFITHYVKDLPANKTVDHAVDCCVIFFSFSGGDAPLCLNVKTP